MYEPVIEDVMDASVNVGDSENANESGSVDHEETALGHSFRKI